LNLTRIKNNRIIINIISLGSATIINAVLALIVGIVTRNILGPEQFGYWLTISIMFTFIPLLQLGTLNAMNREVPFFVARGEHAKVQLIRESVFSFMFTIPVRSVALLIVISITFFFLDIAYEYKIGLFLAAIISGLTYFSGYVEMYYKSEQDFKTASRLISIRSITQSVVTVILVFIWGYEGLYLGLLIALLLQVFIAKKTFPSIRKKFDGTVYKSLIKIGFPILLVGFVWSIMIASDRLIIAFFMTPEDLGNYGVGMLVFSSMMLLPQVIGQVLYPKVVEMVSQERHKEIKSFFWKTNIFLAVIVGIIVIIGYLTIPYLVAWFMPEYENGIKAAQILVLGIYPLTLVGFAANYFNSTQSQGTYITIQGIAIFVNIALSILFIKMNPQIHIVALATSISYVIYFIIMNLFFLIKVNQVSK